MAEPTVYVVDDDSAARESMEALFTSAGLHVETFPDGDTFLNGHVRDRPACLVLDVRLPGMSGLQIQKRLAEADAGIPIIFVSGNADVGVAVETMRAGAVHFIEKPYRPQTLLECVNEAMKKDQQACEWRNRQTLIRQRLASLTRRESEVVEMLVNGKTTRQIAQQLELSPKTIHAHRTEAMTKLQAGSLAELIRMLLPIQSVSNLTNSEAAAQYSV